MIQTANVICVVYRDGAISWCTVSKRLTKFRTEHCDLDDQEWSSSPTINGDAEIETLIENNPGHTARNITDIFHILQLILNEIFTGRISICDSLFKIVQIIASFVS